MGKTNLPEKPEIVFWTVILRPKRATKHKSLNIIIIKLVFYYRKYISITTGGLMYMRLAKPNATNLR